MAGTRSARHALAVALALLALTAFAAPAPVGAVGHLDPPAIEPIVGPELPVAYPAPGTPKFGQSPAVASGGGVWLVVWNGVMMARVDRAGTVIDPARERLSPGRDPDVAFDGRNFLVVWSSDEGSTVRARRVSPDGQVLDAADLLVSDVPGAAPKVSFDGQNYLVVWQETGFGIQGARVSPGGAVLGSTLIVDSTAGVTSVDIAFNGTDHLLVWVSLASAVSDILGTLVSPDGSAQDPAGVPIAATSGEEDDPAVASLGDGFFVAWGRSGDVLGSRVDGAGQVLDPAGIPLAPTEVFAAAPTLASDGTNVLVAWSVRVQFTSTVQGTRVDPTGDVLDPSGIPMGSFSEPLLTFDGDHYLLVQSGPIRGTRVTVGGAVLDPAGIDISIGANGQFLADVAFDGTNSFVLWFDDRDTSGAVYGARVGPEGQILDGTGIEISDGDADARFGAFVASDGTDFLVVWAEVEGAPELLTIRAALVSSSGRVLDRFDVMVGGPGQFLTPMGVSFGGGTYFVPWMASTETSSELRGTRVSSTGTVEDPSGILLTDRAQFDVDVAFGGSEFLVVWTEQGPSTFDIHGTRVTPAGSVVTPGGFPISHAEADQIAPSVAWNGDRYLVAWSHWNQDFGNRDIYGIRLDGSGAALDPADIPISTGPGPKDEPFVAANGPFLVTWTDFRRGQSIYDLFATRVDPDGTVAHPDGFPVLIVPDGSYRNGVGPADAAPAVGTGNFWVGYQRDVYEQPYGTYRTFLRKVTPK